MKYTIALFGEAQRGEFRTAYYCNTLTQLSDFFGEPPSEGCKGLSFAVQTLLFDGGVIYFRVHEEGFSVHDYLFGFSFLENKEICPAITAIGLPGVGNSEIIEATMPICDLHKSFLILSEQDLYDYLTCRLPD